METMEEPSRDFREYISGRLEELAGTEESQVEEDQVEELLQEIEKELDGHLPPEGDEDAEGMARVTPADREEAFAQLGAVESWASLASYAVARFYAPASPWPWKKLAGWSKGVAERLRRVAGLLLTPLKGVAYVLGASLYSISVGFPFGVAIGLEWP
jgi:hypothetical protein